MGISTVGVNARSKAKGILRKILFSIIIMLMPGLLSAQFSFSDNATNYGGSWTNGSNFGTGYNAWTISSGGGNAGTFIGNPSSNGMGTAGIGTTAFGLFGHGGNTVNAVRYFGAGGTNVPMLIGDVFSFHWVMNWDAGGGFKGFDLRADGTTVFNVNNGGSSTITTSNGTADPNYGTTPMLVTLTRTSWTQYSFSMTSRSGGATYNTTINSTSNINNINIYCGNQSDNNGNRNIFFNAFNFTKAAPYETNFDVTDPRILTGSNNLTKTGAGNLTLTGVNTFTGNVIVNANFLIISNDNQLGAVPGVATADKIQIGAGTLGINGTITINANRGMNLTNASSTLDVFGANTATYNGIIAGTGGLTKAGPGTLVIGGSNTYTGNSTISNGVLRINNINALGSTAGGTTVSSGCALELNVGTASLVYAAEPLTLNGTGISNGGALRKTGANSQSFGGAITINSDARINIDAGTLQYTGAMNINGNTAYIGGSLNFEFMASSSVSGATKTTANGAIFKDGAGTFWIRPVVGMTGNITLVSGQIRQYTGTYPNSGLLIIQGGIYAPDNTTARDVQKPTRIEGNFQMGYAAGNGALNFTGAMDLNAGTRTITTLSSANTISGIISNGGLTKEGSGTLTLSGANIYAGATNINAGSLTCGATTTLPAATTVTLANTAGAVLNLNNFNQTVASISGGGATGGNITLGSATLTSNQTANTTFSGIISGTGGLTKSGTGTLTLSGSNSYTGATIVNGGSLQLGASNVIADASNLTLNGGNLRTGSGAGFNETAGTLNLTANSSITLGTGAHTLTFANSSALSWTGATTLTINGWSGTAGSSGTAGKIFFGSAAGTLTAGQLAQISFNGYPGIPILLSSGELVPPAGVAFYTWNATTGSADWQAAASWTPARNTPAATDVLNFTNGGSSIATNVPTQTIAQFIMSNNTAVTLQAASSGNVLTLQGDLGTDLNIIAGTTLTLGNGANALTLNYTGTGHVASIAGTLSISNGNTSNTYDATNSTTTVSGTINNGGIVTSNSTILTISGTYNHTHTSTPGKVARATWSAGSNMNIIGYTTNTDSLGQMDQSFHHVTYNCASQTSTTNLGLNNGSIITDVNGNFTVTSTGSGRVRFNNVSTYFLTVFGNYVQNGGTVDFTGSGSANITFKGNVTLNAGTLDIKNVLAGGTNVSIYIEGNLNLTGGTFTKSSTDTPGATIYFSKATGIQTFSQSAATVTGSNNIAWSVGNGTSNTLQLTSNINLGSTVGNFIVTNGATLDFQTFTLSGSGVFLSFFGSTLTSANTNATGAFTTSGANGSVQLAGTRNYIAGTNFTLNGTAAQTTGNGIGQNAVGTLTISNTAAATPAVTLSSSASVSTLALNNGRIALGSNNLTVTGTTAASITGGASASFVQTNGTGQLRRSIATAGLPLTYAFPVGTSTNYTPASYTFTANSTARDLYVRAVSGIHPSMNSPVATTDYINNRYWASDLSVTTGTYTYESSFTFLAGDVSGTLANVRLNRWDIAGSTWSQDNASSAAGTVLSSSAGQTQATLPLNNCEFAGRVNIIGPISYTWNGSASGSWNTAGNWTPSGIPVSIDNITIPASGSYTNQLNISGSQSINDFTVNATGTYTLSGTGVLTINGNYTNSSATAPTFSCTSTLNIASSSPQTIPAADYGTLVLTGGARTLSSVGIIRICGDFTPVLSMVSTGSTVVFNGTIGQSISPIATTFHNLTISNTSSTVGIGAACTIANALVVSAGATFVAGANTLTINSGATASISGILRSGGTITGATAASLTVNSGGAYEHNYTTTGGVIPTATWSSGSTCRIIGYTTFSGPLTAANGWAQSFSNFEWACLNQTSTVNWQMNATTPPTIGGNFIVSNTNTAGNGLRLASSGTYTLNIGGNLQFDGGAGTARFDGNGSTAVGTINISGNLSLGSAGTSAFLNSTSGSVTVNFVGAAAQTATVPVAGNITGIVNFRINNTAGLTISNGSTLPINANATFFRTLGNVTLSGTGSISYNSVGGGSLAYDGSASITASNSEFPTINGPVNLRISNTAGVTMHAARTLPTNGVLAMNGGLLRLSNFDLTLANTAAGAITGTYSTTNMVVTDGTGRLIRSLSTVGLPITMIYPIGDVTGTAEYSPVSITVSASSVNRSIGFNVIDAEHPQNSNPLTQTHFLSRYWTANNSAAGTYTYSASFTYPSADINGTQATIKLNKYDGTLWNETASSAAANVLSTTGTVNETTYPIGSTAEFTGRVNPTLYFRSVTSGNWNTNSTWEVSSDVNFVAPAPVSATFPPSALNSSGIFVRNTHTVTINTAVTADDLTIDAGGTLTIASPGNFTLNNGAAATDLTINGILNLNSTTLLSASTNVINNGTWTTTTGLTASGTATHNATGIYVHGVDGGSVPISTWNSGSILRITGIVTSSTIGGMTQTFHHVEYNCTSQTITSVQLSGDINGINGNLTINSTGGTIRELRLFSNNVNTNTSLTVAGDVILNAGKLAVTNSSSTNTANPVFNINGNLTLNGSSVFDLTGNSVNTAAGSTVNLLGNLSINGTATIVRTQATPSTFRFNKTSGTQTFTAAAPTSAVSAGAILWQVGNGTTTPELILSNDFVMNAASTFTVNTGAILDAGTQIIRGTTAGTNGSFTLNSGSTLKTANTAGIVAALAATTGSVQTGTAKTFDGGASYVYKGIVNQVTGTGLPLTLVSPGQITIANTGGAGNNTVTLTTNNTTAPTLNLQSGVFAIGTGNTLNISNNGSVAVTSGDFASGSTGGTLNGQGALTFSGNSNPYNVYASGGINFGAGTVTMQNGGVFRINAGGFVNTNAPFYASGSTLEYNTGGNYDRGFEWSAVAGRGYPHHVTLLNTTLNPAKTGGAYASTAFNAGGNLTINSGANIYMDFGGFNMAVPLIINGNLTLIGNLSGSQTAGGDLRIRGNWINNGSGANYFANSRAVFFDGSTAQTLGGSNATINPFAFFILNNFNGLTLLSSQQVNNEFTFINGQVILGNFNLTMSPLNAAINGVTAANYFVTNGTGQLFRNFNNTNTIFPVGPTSTSYNPITLNQSGTIDNIGVRVKATPPFGAAVNDVNEMIKVEYYLSESVAGGNNLFTGLQWNLVDEGSAFNRNSGVYHGMWNGSAWQVRASNPTSGSNPYFSNSTANYTGNLSNTLFAFGNINGFFPCLQTASAGDWNTGSTWNGGAVPSTDANVCLLHNVTVTSADATISNVTINTGGTLNIGAAYNLDILTLGSVVNNSGSTANLGSGTVRFLGTGAFSGTSGITANNIQLNGNTTFSSSIATSVSGNLTLNSGSFITSGSPTYTATSTLIYNTTGSYNVSSEWNANAAAAGLGAPQNVTIQNGTTVNMPAANRGLSGNLNISNGTLALNNTSGDLYVGGNWSRAVTAGFTSNNRAVFFTGSANQTITVNGGGTESFAYLLITKTGGSLILDNATNTDVNVTASTGNVLQINGGNTLDLNGRTFSLTGTSGNFNIPSGAAIITGTTGSVFAVSGGIKTVTPGAGATLNFGANVRVALSNGFNFGASTSTVQGILQIANGGFVSTNPPSYATGSTLRYFTGSNFNRSTEWSATSGPGYPYNVEVIQNGTVTTLDVSTGSSPVQIAGNLTVNTGGIVTLNNRSTPLIVKGNVSVGSGASGTLILSTVAGGDVQIAGNLSRIDAGVITQNGREIEMNGTIPQTIGGISSFEYLKINNSGSTVIIGAPITINNRLSLVSGTLIQNSYSVTMANGSKIMRSNGFMEAPPVTVGSDQYDMEYQATVTTDVEYLGNNEIRDLIIGSGNIVTLQSNKTFNRNLDLAGDLNLGTNTLTARGKATNPSFSGSINLTGGGTRLITGAAGSKFDITGLGANEPTKYSKTFSTFAGTQLAFDSNVQVRIGDGSVDFGSGNPVTINGVLQVLLGGSVGLSLNSCFYGTNSTLRFANTVDYQVGSSDKTWAAGAINSGLPGIPWNVEVSDGGTDLTLNDTRALRGNLTITSGTFTLSTTYTGSFNIGGNWTRSGATSAFNNAFNKKVVFDRQIAGDQTITTSTGVLGERFYDLEVSPFGGNVTLGASTALEVFNNLNFVSGKLNLSGNALAVGTASANGSITNGNASAYIITAGGTVKQFTNTNTAFAYPVGDVTSYSPMLVTLDNGAQTGASITVSVTPVAHPNAIGTNAATEYIKRFWSVIPNGLTVNPIYDVEYRYADVDIQGSEAILRPVKYSTATATPGWIGSPGSGANAIDGTTANFDSGLNKFNWDNLTTFSDFSAAGNGAPLPIELLSFDAQAVGNTVLVNWTTASEINNDYFTIERSTDAANYTAIGTIDGAGNSNSSRSYQFTDLLPLQGVSYYRLRQTDFNGTTEVFDPAVVNFNASTSQGVSMFPNPAVDYTHVMLQSEASGNGTIRITDLSGRMVFEQNVSMKTGVQPFTLETRSLSMGTYLVSISMADGRIYTLPLVKN